MRQSFPKFSKDLKKRSGEKISEKITTTRRQHNTRRQHSIYIHIHMLQPLAISDNPTESDRMRWNATIRKNP